MKHPRPKAVISPWYICHIIAVAGVGFFGYSLSTILTPNSYNPYIYLFLFFLALELAILTHELAHGLLGRHLGLHWESYYLGFTKFSVQLADTQDTFCSNKNQIGISLIGPASGLTIASLFIVVPFLSGQHWTNPLTLAAVVVAGDNLLALTPFIANTDGRKFIKASWRTLRGKGQERFFPQ